MMELSRKYLVLGALFCLFSFPISMIGTDGTDAVDDGPIPPNDENSPTRAPYEYAELSSIDLIKEYAVSGEDIFGSSWNHNNTILATAGYGPAYDVRVLRFNGTDLIEICNLDYGVCAYSTDWSPNGSYLAVSGMPVSMQGGFSVYRFDGTSLAHIRSFSTSGWTNSVSWSPEGDHVAVGGRDDGGYELKVYSFNGTDLALVCGVDYPAYVSKVSWTPDGQYLAAGDEAGNLRVYSFDGTTLSILDSLTFYKHVRAVAFSPDGNYLAVGGDDYDMMTNDGYLGVYSFNGLTLQSEDSKLFAAGYCWVDSVSWSVGTKYLTAGGAGDTNDLQIYEFDGDVLTQRITLDYHQYEYSLDWSSDHHHLFISGRDGSGNGYYAVYNGNYSIPNLARNDIVNSYEDTELYLDVLANDQTLTGDIFISSFSQTLNGTLTLSTDNKTLVYEPKANWSGGDSFTYRHTDMPENCKDALVELFINPVNDGPMIVTSDVTSAIEDEYYSVFYIAEDSDPYDYMTWSLETDSDWLHLDPGTGELNGFPREENMKRCWVEVTVTDSYMTMDVHKFVLNVENVNDAPVIRTMDVTVADEDVPYNVRYEADDLDNAYYEMTWSLNTDADWLQLVSNDLLGTPDKWDIGTYWVNISVTDNRGGNDSSNFTLTVNDVNEAPVIMVVPTSFALEGELYYQALWALDDDLGDTLTWGLDGAPDWLSIDSMTGVLSGTPDNDSSGVFLVSLHVMDAAQIYDYVYFMLTVLNGTETPVEPGPNITKDTDTDNDGMPDIWEQYYGLDPNDPSDATGDKDLDSVSNLNEYLAGTSPIKSDLAPADDDDTVDDDADDDSQDDDEAKDPWEVNNWFYVFAIVLIIGLISIMILLFSASRKGSAEAPMEE